MCRAKRRRGVEELSAAEGDEGGGVNPQRADLLLQSVFLQGVLIKGARARLWHPEQTGWARH